MKLCYFRETVSGDYGVVDIKSWQGNLFEGRTTSISGDHKSMGTAMMSHDFLIKNTKRVRRNQIPKKWLKAIQGE